MFDRIVNGFVVSGSLVIAGGVVWLAFVAWGT